MTQATAWIAGVVATAAAALFACADSALLASHAADPEAPSSMGFAERERQHRALSMARVLGYIVAGAAFAQAMHFSTLDAWTRILTVVGSAVVIAAVSEAVGRAAGYADAQAIHVRLKPLVRLVALALRPIVTLGSAIDRALLIVIPQVEDLEAQEASAEQFLEVVASEAEVSSAEEALIHGVFSLGETEVHEIMVPRVDIVGIEDVTPWSEVLDRIRSSEHARFPVYRETIDEVVGILYAKDVLPSIVAGEDPANGWLSLIRLPTFIPTGKRIDSQLREFQATRAHIAIVSDEYGGTAGLVTIEDILEEIVGEIRDEYDVEEPEITQDGSTRYWVAGRVSLDELSERLNVDFDVEDVATVGGLVYTLFGRVPKGGESLTRAGFRVVVERVRRRRIERVYFERVAKLEPKEEEE
ncbi:MAG TPA: hemolysin family protein [Gemmatimonadaceae bacterium]|jgi:CBS domain containing-hemolysin-like protein